MPDGTAGPASAAWRIGIDVGGTFTDAIAWNEATGEVRTTKVLSTARNPEQAFMACIDRLKHDGTLRPEAVSYVVHATTIVTNAVLQRQLARTALVITEGFGDLLEIARQVRPDPYDVFAVKPPPLVPRELCFEIRERLAADGSVITALDPGDLDRLVGDLRAAKVAAVAICLLHAYRNPQHELAVAEAIAAQLPGIPVSSSSPLSSEFREFPRATTTIVNAGVMPLVTHYLGSLDSKLRSDGLGGARLVMQSNGGVADFAHSATRPAFMVESGPAAGVVGTTFIAEQLGERRVISFDMGGTTAKVCLLEDGRSRIADEIELGADATTGRDWFSGASGYPLLTPSVDLIEIGAGGGSIAWLDEGGKLRVGPTSAGASPGPACYGLGGTDATVTDANLVLGRLDPAYFSGGEITLDVAAAERAIGALAGPLGLGVVEVADGIIRIADAAMSQALRVVSIQRGHDPRAFSLVAFGGAGPLHAASLADEAGIGTILIPPRPGIFSAAGLLFADLRHDFAVIKVVRLDRADAAELEEVFARLKQDATAVLRREGVSTAQLGFELGIDVRYVGQSHPLTIPLEDAPLSAGTLAEVRARFDQRHQITYGFAEPTEPSEIVKLRLVGVGRIPKPALSQVSEGGIRASGDVRRRRVHFAGHGFLEACVHSRYCLEEGTRIAGPAVIEEAESTILVPPAWHARVDRFGVLRLADARRPAA